jgi:hypothetical protein
MIRITATFKANGIALEETMEFTKHTTPTQVTRLLKHRYNNPKIRIADVVIIKIVDTSLVIA